MEDLKSKSQRKRDADALQTLGNQLITWSVDDLEQLPLTETLLQAICAAKSIKSHGAVRRQSQLIGKLIRSADHEAIVAAFAAMQAEDGAQTAEFHAAEIWRDKLIEGDSAVLSEFVRLFQPEDIQHLRQLIKKSKTAATDIKQKTARRALFRYIRPYL